MSNDMKVMVKVFLCDKWRDHYCVYSNPLLNLNDTKKIQFMAGTSKLLTIPAGHALV